MKTMTPLLFLVLLLSGQLSFGSGSGCCIPDSSSIQLIASSLQQQLDYLECESHIITVKVPSLESKVALKLSNKKMMLEQMQIETEKLDTSLTSISLEQLLNKLKSRMPVQ